MKRLVENVENEGFDKLLGETITLFCVNYIYTGKLIGVNKNYVLLQDPKIVYETGPFNKEGWTDAQSMPNDIYIMLSAVESFGVIK